MAFVSMNKQQKPVRSAKRQQPSQAEIKAAKAKEPPPAVATVAEEPQCDGGLTGLDAIIAPYAPDTEMVHVEDTMIIPDYNDGKKSIDRTLDAMAESPIYDHIISPINGAEYDIRPFEFNFIGEDFTVVNWGKRRSGKSLWTKAFMRATRFRYCDVVVFTGSYYDYEYVDLVPEEQIIDGLNLPILHGIIKEQEKAVEHIRKTGINDKNISMLLIFDDVLGEGLHHKADMDRLFFNGRHLKMTIVINLQDTKGIPPMMRSNTDVAISYVMRSQRDKEAMREQFADFLQNDNDWDAVIAPLLERFSFIFIGFITSTPQLKQCASITIGIAPPYEQGDNEPPMVMGTRKSWENNAEQLLRMKNGWMLMMGSLDDDWGVITNYTPGFVGADAVWTPALEPMPDWFIERSRYGHVAGDMGQKRSCGSAMNNARQAANVDREWQRAHVQGNLG